MVLDGHAEVLARRSFLKFLYSEIEAALKMERQEEMQQQQQQQHGAMGGGEYGDGGGGDSSSSSSSTATIASASPSPSASSSSSSSSPFSSVFEPRKRCEWGTTSNSFKLRKDVFFHLYISVLPCGDAKMFSKSDVNFLRPLIGIHCHNGCGKALPSYDHVNGHWPTMGRKCEGLLRARLDTGRNKNGPVFCQLVERRFVEREIFVETLL